MRFIAAAVLLVPVLQSNAFTTFHAINKQNTLQAKTSINTATNPFESTSKVCDIYSSAMDPNGPDLIIIEGENNCIEAGLIEYCGIDGEPQPARNEFIEKILSSYIGPRAILAAVAILYATNFSLGAIMNDNLPASASTSGRMVLASMVLSPFLFQLKPNLRWQVLIGGAFVSLGYITQVST